MNAFKDFAAVLRQVCVCFLGVVFLGGCDSVISHTVSIDAEQTVVAWPETVPAARSDWTIASGELQVWKPVPMAYLKSFEQKFSMDSRFDDPIVECTDLNLSEDSLSFIEQAYSQKPESMESVVSIPMDAFNGPRSFDLSLDGKRLVTLNSDHVELYNLETAKRLGSFALPGEWARQPHAICFCGNTRDFLVASDDRICRISSRDGSVQNEIKGLGETIAKWKVSPSGDVLVLLTESGTLWGGEATLEGLSQINSDGTNVRDMDLFSNGKSIIADVSVPLLYHRNDQNVWLQQKVGFEFETEHPHVVAGSESHCWVDGPTIEVLSKKENAEGKVADHLAMAHSYWPPNLACSYSWSTDSYSFLVTGERLVRGKLQWVIYDLAPANYTHSAPIELDYKPQRLLCSDGGSVVAILDKRGINVSRRTVWYTADHWQVSELGYYIVNQYPLDEVERLYEALGRQTRYSALGAPSDLQQLLLSRVSYRWNYLEQQGDDLPEEQRLVLEKIRSWHKQGGVLARSVSGFRHHRIAWDARGNGMGNTVSAKAWETFNEHNELAYNELSEVCAEVKEPPLLALETLVHVQMDHRPGTSPLVGVNDLARRCVELYPGSIGVAEAIAFKLLPQWYGEEGELVSFARAHADLYDGRFSDLVYAKLLGVCLSHHANPTMQEKRQIDPRRLQSAIDTVVEWGLPIDLWVWEARQVASSTGASVSDVELYEKMIEAVGVVPRFDSGSRRWGTPNTTEIPKRLYKEARQAAMSEADSELAGTVDD
ncbi:hypothetical protein [Rhodopirellula sp. MGV]|uniref:hypothetical protein n=1 Tax=Rhodopirellula sp. MGV TaxID=2023130 RepID=UPI000B964419|nr:hypothetical protein [Rhodopirellula sp. MGV]OYP31053.1 hypothetical protein CGZ80_22045 [Rhodopirellula sp. MGV]PNY34600.1 hypothetical protein C2E31_21660 [Rhodopirellula baltica]